MPNLLTDLNPEQLAAVTLPCQHALILAGAGSGKTRVLTTRIAWLLQSGEVGPAGVLAVTFTNKAAKEMQARLGAMLPVDPKRMWIGTFHGLANRMLRAHHRDAGLPSTFQILDSSDQLSAIKRLLRALNVDDERFPAKSLQQSINGWKEQGVRADGVDRSDPHSRKMADLYAAYDEQCQREGVVDFGELMLRSFELLDRHVALREHYRSRFRYILIDEFQDTNDLQYAWLTLLAGPQNALFAVGDDDQSIYAFRGAKTANMFRFEREFAQGRLIKLEQNYRSGGHILAAANHLIGHNRERLGKELWTSMGDGEPVRAFEAASDFAEAQFILSEISTLAQEGRLRSEMAILYRSNAQSRVLEHALFSAGVPYRVFGGLRFFDRAEVKHALAYLRLMDNPHDDTAFLRVVNFPPRGIGARSVEQLQDIARERSLSLYASVGLMSGRAGGVLASFVSLIESMRFDTQNASLPELTKEMLESSGLLGHYRLEKDGEDRVSNLEELVNAALAFCAEEGITLDQPAGYVLAKAAPADSGSTAPALPGGQNTVLDADEIDAVQSSPLTSFLTHATLESGENQAGEGRDAVQLMTVHAAKGLEFGVVFATGLEEGLFPHENSASDPNGLEEERRLMYVAITRARDRLYLTLAATRMLHGQTRYNLRSRFLDELPERAVKWLTPRVQRDRWSGWDGSNGYAQGEKSAERGRGAWESDWRTGGSRSSKPLAVEGVDTTPIPAWAGQTREGWRVGQRVRHSRFGEGTIVKLEGQGEDARAQINFGREGVKWLALAVAKLEKIGG